MEYFAKIQEPKKLRLSMMKTAKESIIMMSLLEEVEQIRLLRSELMESVKEDFKNMEEFCKEISNLLGDEKTRQDLIESFKAMQKEEEKADLKAIKLSPKFKTEEHVHEKSHAHKHVIEVSLPKIDTKTKTEVDRLDYTLKQIEEKIAALSK